MKTLRHNACFDDVIYVTIKVKDRKVGESPCTVRNVKNVTELRNCLPLNETRSVSSKHIFNAFGKSEQNVM